MNFHLAHIVPPGGCLHGLNGYKEVIDTIQWGLQQLGHRANYGLNQLSVSADETTIIFGAHMLASDVLEALPRSTIVYNFEQMRNADIHAMNPLFKYVANNFQVWDYSDANLETWNRLGAKNVRVVPIGYAPILKRINKPEVQDIDVLMYGMTGQERLNSFHHLSHSGLSTVFICGMYGQARDDLIARSKLIVNINHFATSKIFEVVRVSYLLANHKAVVATLDPATRIDDEMRAAIWSSTASTLVQDCQSLVGNDVNRTALENAGFEMIQRHDIKKILERAFDSGSVV